MLLRLSCDIRRMGWDITFFCIVWFYWRILGCMGGGGSSERLELLSQALYVGDQVEHEHKIKIFAL